MVGYFKKQNILFIMIGGLLGLAAAFVFAEPQIHILTVFMSVLAGVALGRLASTVWANKQLRKYNELLFTKVEPQKFLDEFAPIVERTPRNTVEYVDGCNKLAYAWEALGEFEKARDCLVALEPENLKRSAMSAMITTANNLARVQLLLGNAKEAQALTARLRLLAEDALPQDTALGKSTLNCVRLYENWLLVLSGEKADEDYLEKEVDRALNRIRKSELQLLLASAYDNIGESELADDLRMDAMSDGIGLWTGTKARELLSKSVD